jgi:hypothetical protein
MYTQTSKVRTDLKQGVQVEKISPVLDHERKRKAETTIQY